MIVGFAKVRLTYDIVKSIELRKGKLLTIAESDSNTINDYSVETYKELLDFFENKHANIWLFIYIETDNIIKVCENLVLIINERIEIVISNTFATIIPYPNIGEFRSVLLIESPEKAFNFGLLSEIPEKIREKKDGIIPREPFDQLVVFGPEDSRKASFELPDGMSAPRRKKLRFVGMWAQVAVDQPLKIAIYDFFPHYVYANSILLAHDNYIVLKSDNIWIAFEKPRFNVSGISRFGVVFSTNLRLSVTDDYMMISSGEHDFIKIDPRIFLTAHNLDGEDCLGISHRGDFIPIDKFCISKIPDSSETKMEFVIDEETFEGDVSLAVYLGDRKILIQ